MSVRAELEERTKRFSIRVIRFANGFEKSRAADVIVYQLVKSCTSIGANYREAGRATSQNDFIHKMGIVEKEAAETQYWLELCCELNLSAHGEGKELLDESSQLLAIVTAAGRTARANRGKVSEADAPFDIE